MYKPFHVRHGRKPLRPAFSGLDLNGPKLLLVILYNLNTVTYPEVCLRARETQKVSRVDPKPILRDFMREVTAKFPTICGAPMKLQSKAKFPLAWLFESGQVCYGLLLHKYPCHTILTVGY